MARSKRRVFTVDVETDPFLRDREPLPFLWGVYDGEPGGFRHFPDADSMLRWLHAQGPLIVYAHNGGKFDYLYLFDFFEAYNEILIINGRIAKFTIGEIEFRDSWNILPLPLRKLGKGEIEFWKLEKAVRKQHMKEILEYNKQDCVSLWEAVTGFIKLYGAGLTLAGAALEYWSKKFNHEKPKSDHSFYESIKPYYSGGRVQCFYKGIIKGDFHVVDINSAYPYAMTFKHPLSVRFSTCHPKKSDKIIPQSLYRIEGSSKGGLPWREMRTIKNKKTGIDEIKYGALAFPEDGEDEAREYCCTGWELQAALDTKTLTKWKPLDRKDFLKEIDFQDYVGHFYKMKKDAEKGSLEYQFAKLMQNSLYGKFGANPDEYSSYGIVPTEDIIPVMQSPGTQLGRNCGPWDWAGQLGHFALMEGKDPATGEKNPVRSDFYNVATAASITGFVRAYLWRHICKVRAKGGSVLYCDTDSIVYRLEGAITSHPFDLSNELGDWGHEGVFSEGAIAGKKLYAFKAKDPKAKEKWKKACKGVKIEPEQIVEIANGSELVWLADAPAPSIHRKLKKGETRPATKYMHRKVRMT